MSRATDLRAAEFDRLNPVVFDTLKTLALQGVRRGRKRMGIAQLWELMRWELDVPVQGQPRPKFNNDHRAYFARKLMAEVPELAGIFQTRGGGSVGIADSMVATFPDDGEDEQRQAA